MHKPSIVVFSLLLLSSSVGLMGMEGDERFPKYTPPPSVLGMVSRPTLAEDSPHAKERIAHCEATTRELIRNIKNGYQLPVELKGTMCRKARTCGLEKELEAVIAAQKTQDGR